MTHCNGVCHWPHELDPDCQVHGRVFDCACGMTHETVPLFELGDSLMEKVGVPSGSRIWVMGVCRQHRRHVPCEACGAESERLAEAALFGQAFRPPKDLHLGRTT